MARERTAALLVGLTTLALEVLGVHWMAPWFGASSVVWTNQIGVVLLALAIGGWLGGRMARLSDSPRRSVSRLLLASGLLVALAQLLLPLLGGWLLPDQLLLDDAGKVMVLGSLASSLLLLAPPLLLMGMSTPLLIESAGRSGRSAGSAAGEIYALSTLGSLFGVFGSTWIGIPFLGVGASWTALSVLLILTALLLGFPRRALAAVLLPLSTLALSVPEPNLPPGATLVGEPVETAYQRVRVVEFEGGERWLQMNEGLDSYQSRAMPDGTPGGYYDLFALAACYAGLQPDGASRILNLGHAAGSSLVALAPWLNATSELVGVELDPGALEVARRHFPRPVAEVVPLRTVGGLDARTAVRAGGTDWDLILLDAYARQFELPLHLTTVEFFTELHTALSDGGVVAINLSARSLDHPLLAAIASSLAVPFGPVRAHRVPFSRNVLLLARKGRPLLTPHELLEALPPGMPASVAVACLPGESRLFHSDSGQPLHDARNRLALLQSAAWTRD